MPYHIKSILNSSNKQGATTNPANNRDNYVLRANESVTPEHPPLINKPAGRSINNFTEALVWANFIYTGVYNYCFWDSEYSQIFGIKQEDPPTRLVIYEGTGGDKKLTVNSDGSIGFTPV